MKTLCIASIVAVLFGLGALSPAYADFVLEETFLGGG